MNAGRTPNSRKDSRVRRPRKNSECRSVTAASTYFLVPAGPHRSVVSSNPATCAAVISVLISLTTSAITSAALARQEWTNPAETRAPVTSAISWAHRPTGTCWNTTRYTARARRFGPMLTADPAAPCRAGRHMHLAALAAGLVEVMLDAPCRHQRHLQLLERPDDAQVRRPGQVRPAPARPSGTVIDHLIGFRPRHRRARRPRLLPAPALAAPAAPLPPGRHPSRQVIGRRRHRGVPAVTAQPAPQLRDLGPQLPDRPPQLTDQLIPRRA